MFRIAVAVAGLVPVGAGLGGVALGACFLDPDLCVELDSVLRSHVHYLSGLLLGVGVAFWATLRQPEAHTARYRLLTAIVFLGGLARLYGHLFQIGAPSGVNVFALTMELFVTPAICFWQMRIARIAGSRPFKSG